MPEVTENYIRIPVKIKMKDNPIATITISKTKGIKALYDTKRKIIVTYLFARNKGWTLSAAKSWSSKDSKKFEVVSFSKAD